MALQSAPDLGLYRLNTEAHRGILQLSGIVPNEHLRQRAEEEVVKSVGKTIQIENTIRPVDVPSDPRLVAQVQQLSSRLDEMMRGFTIDTRFYFNPSENQIQPSEMKKVLEIEGFLAKHPEMHLRLIGHCDTSGSLDANLKLAYEIAISVRDTLVARGVDVNRLHAIGISEPPPDVSVDGPAYLNRCVLFEPIQPPR